MLSRSYVPHLVLAAAWIAFVWAWEPSVLVLTVDDSFYYVKTAVNASQGYGFTFDQINPTNGFHPLWMWVLVPLVRALGPSLDTVLRGVLSGQVALVFLTTAALQRLLFPAASSLRSVLLVALFANFYFAKIFVNGLESALQFSLLAALLVFFARLDRAQDRPSPSSLILLGLLGAAATLARSSVGLFALPMFALLAWRRDARPLRSFSLANVAYALPVALYLAANQAMFHHWLPVSAVIKASAEAGSFLHRVALVAFVVAATLLVTLTFFGSPRRVWSAATARNSGDTSAALALLLLVYAFAQSTVDAAVRGIVKVEIWYLVPHALVLVLAVMSVERSRAVSIATGVALVLFAAASWALRLQPESYSPYLASRRTGVWLSSHTEENDVIAGWDCGITAAYSGRRFVNLDGLINSWDFKERYLDTGRVDRFLDEHAIDTVAQPFSIEGLRDGSAMSRAGIDLSSWHVLMSDCVTFRPVLSPTIQHTAYLVLSRTRSGPTLRSLGARVCDR